MIRYFVFSGAVHAFAALCMVFLLAPSAKKAQATYTIDFIGTGKVQAVTNQEVPAQTPAAAPKAAVQIPQEKPAETPPPETKPSKKAYASKTEISKKPKKVAKTKEEAPLAAPSILDEPQESAKETAGSQSSTEGDFAGGNIQTDFADFPYPWYITQVRNSLWSEWEKRRPVGNVLSAMVTFAIARDGKVKNLKIERSSGDDSFDFSAKSSVINAGPFAPLPMLFEKDELTITVEFRQEK
jgi:TonB family protein